MGNLTRLLAWTWASVTLSGCDGGCPGIYLNTRHGSQSMRNRLCGQEIRGPVLLPSWTVARTVATGSTWTFTPVVLGADPNEGRWTFQTCSTDEPLEPHESLFLGRCWRSGRHVGEETPFEPDDGRIELPEASLANITSCERSISQTFWCESIFEVAIRYYSDGGRREATHIEQLHLTPLPPAPARLNDLVPSLDLRTIDADRVELRFQLPIFEPEAEDTAPDDVITSSNAALSFGGVIAVYPEVGDLQDTSRWGDALLNEDGSINNRWIWLPRGATNTRVAVELGVGNERATWLFEVDKQGDTWEVRDVPPVYPG